MSSPVTCLHCGGTFDAETVPFCACLASARSPLCPHCGRCICKLPHERQRAFWAAAPAVLVQRRRSTHRHEPLLPEAAPNVEPSLVLVAEDDAGILVIARRIIEGMGHAVLAAERGDEALKMAREFLPSLVLTDALMPGLDGRKLCLQLKQDPATSHIKVVVMTGLYTSPSARLEALQEFKADAFLKKPVDFEELSQTLARLLTPSQTEVR
jgi:two-component system, cell cycle response regulator DivK